MNKCRNTATKRPVVLVKSTGELSKCDAAESDHVSPITRQIIRYSTPSLSFLPRRVAALGLAAGVLLVLLLFCLYRVLCPRNYGQNGVPHGRRRRGDLPCDDYGYSPPVSEISPLLLRGHSMVRMDLERRHIHLMFIQQFITKQQLILRRFE